jgi:hypothetical protein
VNTNFNLSQKLGAVQLDVQRLHLRRVEKLLQLRRDEFLTRPCTWLTTVLRREGLAVFPGTRSPPSGLRCRAPSRRRAA